MKKIITTLVFFALYLSTLGQGSGTTLNFDGAGDFVQLSSAIAIGSGSSTVEMWVKVPTVGTGGLTSSERVGILIGNYNSSPNQNYEITTFGRCRIYWNTGQVDYVSNTDLRDNTWHHLAFVRDLSGTTNFYIYIDGVLDLTGTSTGSNITLATAPRIGGDLRNTTGGINFHGQIDEIRIWSDARSQSEIRDNMCQALVGTETNLIHYYQFDDASGTNLTDQAGSNGGTLTNATWSLSGAPIGDTSTHLYTGSWTGQTINLTSTNRGDAEVNTVSGTPDGVHIYRVDGVPDSVAGISPTLGSSNVYYGTFVANGTSPTYTMEYDYTNYPDAILMEPDLLLYNRDDNSDSTWVDLSATIDSAANTLTETSISSRGEFIIAGSFDPLPIELIDFNAYVINNNSVQLDWQTASEINNDYFTIERSKNVTDWEVINRINGAGNSSTLLAYSTIDDDPYLEVSYYRLKQTDFDGEFSYSNIKRINFNLVNNQIEIFPNPTKKQITITGNKSEIETINIYNILGQNVTNKTIIKKLDNKVIIELTKLSEGTYCIRTKTTANKVYKQ